MKKSFLDFLGGPRVKNPPAKCRGHEFSPGSRKIPHARGKLSPCTTTTETKTEPWSPWATAIESTCPRACAPQQEKPQKWEVHALQLEKARRQQQRPRVAKNKYRSFLSKKKKKKEFNIQFQYSVPISIQESVDYSLPLLTLCFLPQNTSISSFPLLFPIQCCESLWVSGLRRTLWEKITA